MKNVLLPSDQSVTTLQRLITLRSVEKPVGVVFIAIPRKTADPGNALGVELDIEPFVRVKAMPAELKDQVMAWAKSGDQP